MIKVTLEFDTAAEAADFLATLEDGQPAAVEGTPKKGRGRPRKETPAPAAEPNGVGAAGAPIAASQTAPAAAVQSVGNAPPATTQPAAAPAAVPFKAVADAITGLADKDLAAAKGVLLQFGVTKASDLKPEQFAGVVEACAKAANPSSGAGLI